MAAQHAARPIPMRKAPPQTSGPPLFLPINQPLPAQDVYVDEEERRVAAGGTGLWRYPTKRTSVLITLCNVCLLFLGMAALVVFAVGWMRISP